MGWRPDPSSSASATARSAAKDTDTDLVYHWLPDERFPAPVSLEQPAALIGVQYQGTGARPFVAHFG
jgi:hypothetical protein